MFYKNVLTGGIQLGKANQFTGKASAYEKHRPNYPQACIDFIISAAGLKRGNVVADIGAGTGIFSRQLSESGLQVMAVEPNADMRAQAEKMLADYSNTVVLPGSAEETGIAAGSVRLVIAAQAFHWFDAAKFRAECKRILVPGGRVALIWNSRDLESPLVQETAGICRRFCPTKGNIEIVNETSDKSNRCIWQDDAVFKPRNQFCFSYFIPAFVLKYVGKGYSVTERWKEGLKHGQYRKQTKAAGTASAI